jgi:hypothetical protein
MEMVSEIDCPSEQLPIHAFAMGDNAAYKHKPIW